MIETRIRVIYGDTDQMGVVYYANHLRFFEAGRNEFLRAKGLRYRDVEDVQGVRLPVVEAHVAYKQPARYDDLLTVQTTLAKVGHASVRFEYVLKRDAVVLATGHTAHACVDFSGVVCRLPERLVSLLRADASVP